MIPEEEEGKTIIRRVKKIVDDKSKEPETMDEVEICFAIDTTGSMEPYISLLSKSLQKVIDKFSNLWKLNSKSPILNQKKFVRVGLVCYKDKVKQVDYAGLGYSKQEIEMFTTNDPDYVKKINAQEPELLQFTDDIPKVIGALVDLEASKKIFGKILNFSEMM